MLWISNSTQHFVSIFQMLKSVFDFSTKNPIYRKEFNEHNRNLCKDLFINPLFFGIILILHEEASQAQYTCGFSFFVSDEFLKRFDLYVIIEVLCNDVLEIGQCHFRVSKGAECFGIVSDNLCSPNRIGANRLGFWLHFSWTGVVLTSCFRLRNYRRL